MEATVNDLRVHTEKLLKAVEAGEHVRIWFHGRLKAELVPATPPLPARRRSLSGKTLFGGRLGERVTMSRKVKARE